MGGLVQLVYERRGRDFQELGHCSFWPFMVRLGTVMAVCVSLADVLQ